MSREKGKLGINIVENIVLTKLNSLWEKVAEENDDGLDGMIFLKKGNVQTGSIILTQVKYGPSYLKNIESVPDFYRINLGKEYLEKHRPRWLKRDDPVILIYVDKDSRAWWVDLKVSSSYCKKNKSIVLIPRNQRFSSNSKPDLMKLSGAYFMQERIIIDAERDDVNYINLSSPIKKLAREYYKAWANEPKQERSNPILGEIEITRKGWKHISRNGRKVERILHSWILLGIAKRMIKEINYFYRLGRAIKEDRNDYNFGTKNSPYNMVTDYIGLRAYVNFPYRDGSLVQVVIKRIRMYSVNSELLLKRCWFYSVYEKRVNLS